MLKQIWRWVALFPLLHPVWFNLLLLVLAWSLVGVAYQSNDDLVIASVLDGWGDPSYADAHVIFVNPLLTGLLLKAAPVLGGVSVWPVFLALATLSSGAAIFTMLTAHARKARRYDFNTLVLLLVWLLIMPGFYAALQFSHAAFLMPVIPSQLSPRPSRQPLIQAWRTEGRLKGQSSRDLPVTPYW